MVPFPCTESWPAEWASGMRLWTRCLPSTSCWLADRCKWLTSPIRCRITTTLKIFSVQRRARRKGGHESLWSQRWRIFPGGSIPVRLSPRLPTTQLGKPICLYGWPTWMAYDDFLFPFYLREELEGRAGGNPSFNTGVDYTKQLKSSANYGEVVALYQAAGLNLDGDLATLNATTRIAADPGALTYLTNNIIFNGQLSVPVLTLHTTGDGLVPVEVEKAYSTVVREAGNKT